MTLDGQQRAHLEALLTAQQATANNAIAQMHQWLANAQQCIENAETARRQIDCIHQPYISTLQQILDGDTLARETAEYLFNKGAD